MRKFAAWVKNWLRQWWKWITTGETTLSVGERILSAFGVSFVSGWITGLLAWIFKNPWYGVWIFLGTFLLAEAVQAVRAYRLSRSEARVAAEEAAAQHPAPSEAESTELEELERVEDAPSPQGSGRGVSVQKLSTVEAFKSLGADYGQLEAENERLAAELEQAKAERDALREEKHQNLQEQRRQRIDEWRSAIRNHEFGGCPRFASTDTYSQMRPYLRPEVIEMLEAPRTFHVGNEARGNLAYEYTLLDEVARIEREWGLV